MSLPALQFPAAHTLFRCLEQHPEIRTPYCQDPRILQIISHTLEQQHLLPSDISEKVDRALVHWNASLALPKTTLCTMQLQLIAALQACSQTPSGSR